MSTPTDTPRCDHSREHWDRSNEAGMAYATGQEIERELTAALARVRELEAINHRKGEMLDALLNHCDKENGECSECSKIVCPHGCDLHFHHDGCPACAELGDEHPPAPTCYDSPTPPPPPAKEDTE